MLAALGGSSSGLAVITGMGEPERVPMSPATASLMDVFRVAPSLGRWFSEAEDAAGGPKVVVLTDGFWRRKFNADPAVLGRTLTMCRPPIPWSSRAPARASSRSRSWPDMCRHFTRRARIRWSSCGVSDVQTPEICRQ